MSRTIRFHLDENSSRAIADGLRRHGIEVTTTPEVGLIGATDDDQLEFAISNLRILFTQDSDFLAIHRSGVSHGGIVYCPMRTRSPGEMHPGTIRRLGTSDPGRNGWTRRISLNFRDGPRNHVQNTPWNQPMSDDQANDDEIFEEFEISFSPRLEALASRDISLDDFEAALIVALEARQALSSRMDLDDDEIAPLEEMELTIGGATYKVEDLADVEVQSSDGHES